MHISGGKRSRWRSVAGFFVGVSILLYIASLTQSAYRVAGDGPAGASCFAMLLIGWIGVFGRIYAWLANPAILAAWILIWSRRMRPVALLCAAAALALALSFLRQKEMDVDEAGNHAKIVSFGVGYWIWIASIGTMLLGCIWMCVRDWVGFADDAGETPEAALAAVAVTVSGRDPTPVLNYNSPAGARPELLSRRFVYVAAAVGVLIALGAGAVSALALRFLRMNPAVITAVVVNVVVTLVFRMELVRAIRRRCEPGARVLAQRQLIQWAQIIALCVEVTLVFRWWPPR